MYRKIKRFSCLLLAVLLTPLLAALPVHAASFHDVPGGAWYAGAVSSLADQGILAGTGDGYFSPEQKLTRAAFVTMLAKTELSSYDLSQYNFKGSFKDVPASYWANTFINWAAENGIVRGTGDGNFRPGDLLSRQDMAVMVTGFARAFGRKMPAINGPASFWDQKEISPYAAPAVDACQQAGVLSGSDGWFRPKQAASRAEAASMYHRFLQRCPASASYAITRKRVEGVPVRAVTFDPHLYTAGLILGQGQVRGGEAPGSLVSRSGAALAMNAGFFDMSTYRPIGTLISGGQVLTIDNAYAPAKSAFVVDSQGSCSVENFSTSFSAGLYNPETGVRLSGLEDIAMNQLPERADDATRIIFTRAWGESLGFVARDAITVDGSGTITLVAQNADLPIPEDGYVLAQRARRYYEGYFFDSCQSGLRVDLERHYDGTDKDIAVSVGVGPRIVKDGAPYGNSSTYAAEGFRDPGITQADVRRVCIGTRRDGKVVMLYADSNLQKLSYVMKAMGCWDAINCDGGGSTNLYVDGQWLYGPQDRPLNHMLYFR